MTTLRQELDLLVYLKDKKKILEIDEVFKNTRDNVFASLDAKLDLCLPVQKEQEYIRQINENIHLTTEALKRIF